MAKYNASLNATTNQYAITSDGTELKLGEVFQMLQEREALQARVRELEEAVTALLPHLPTEGEALDNASLNEGRMGEYDRLSLQLRRLLKGTP